MDNDRGREDRRHLTAPHSPIGHRRRSRPSSRMQSRRNSMTEEPTERTSLLGAPRARIKISEEGITPRAHFSRDNSYLGSNLPTDHHSREGSWGAKLIQAISYQEDTLAESRASLSQDDRVWYDQFTSTDWVHDSIADAHRAKALRGRKDFWGRVYLVFDAAQGWILSALVGFIVAVLAYIINISEQTLFDWKDGYCSTKWYLSENRCCPLGDCTDWISWYEVVDDMPFGAKWREWAVYIFWVNVFAIAACLLTLTTKTVVPSAYRLSTLDENLAAEAAALADPEPEHESGDVTPQQRADNTPAALSTPPMIYYSAAGSGVAEVRVILSGFVLHGFLGLKTLVIKSVGLVLSVASGMSLGKEGPYVHIATCVGNIACRLFEKYDRNDGKRREVLSAAAAAGVAVAFGAPLGGVLFGLEEVAYFFPSKTLFRTFFCCIIAALTLKFLNPYGTHKIVMFQVHYAADWEYFELVNFVLVGFLGGSLGALFIKASRYWAKSFRKIPAIKRFPLVEVALVALITGLMGYWNVLTKLPVAKLLYNLAAPCDPRDNTLEEVGLCPIGRGEIPPVLWNLLVAFLIKGFLTVITFGIKVPAGIYVPSMVVGGLMGRLIGHVVQLLVMRFNTFSVWDRCSRVGDSTCIQPGVYALIAAGSTMCGVTRLSVTLAVILFELTGSLDYVLPFSLAILVAKWTSDFIEPLSIYDLLTELNSYPFLNNKHKPIFTADLADIVPRVRRERVIDITNSPLVPARGLRRKLERLHAAGELDGGLPILRDGILVGLIPAPDLEYALDQLSDEESDLCLMAQVPSIEDSDDGILDPTDFTSYIDPAPVALDIHSPMDLVYECFVKLGLRYICVLQDGKYAGMTHKKTFAKYMRQIEEEQGHI
ncbi:H(+)/Cl(-) exchange transporter 3 [Cytospora mali]|uniref:H(+)/Cl(-) exchange transporter 3 n=1 Tax=Cytospora mali TaxID=578113 RepID=A0A194V5N7_CYTMA|nr:H(+)/Cl(-) exchange transporter 3 [Valsa mali var. pyri (nom. inval.)]